MTTISPIEAHQQTTVPLLRRPRPPKQSQTSTKETSKRTPKSQTSTKEASKRTPKSQKSSKTPNINSSTMSAYPIDINAYSRQTNDNSLYTDTYEDDTSEFTIHSLYPKGPDFFPPGKILKGGGGDSLNPVIIDGDLGLQFIDEMMEAGGQIVEQDEIAFTLNDFRISTQVAHPMPTQTTPDVVMSRQNYLKLTSWFAANVPKQDSLNTVELQVDLAAPVNRTPRHQVLLELAGMVEDALESSDSSTNTFETASLLTQDPPKWPTPTPDDTLFQSSTSRYFCGQGRSNSPFDAKNQPFISPSEVAILQSMMSGGQELGLKALFLTVLPDLSPLYQTLTHLNISFNDLRVFPEQVLKLQELVCLKMRNNPIREIPNDIRKLKKLQIFCISFSMLAELPPSLFELSNLTALDVSHNTLQWISRDISKLSNLQRINLDGNQLCGLPSTFLKLPQAAHLTISDNLTHPLLWRENTRNQPQALVDLTSVVVSSSVGSLDDGELDTSVRTTLHSRSNGVCDCCGGVVFGAGLRVIRAVAQEKLGVRNLPFIFQVCSPSCRTKLKRRANKYWTPEDDT